MRPRLMATGFSPAALALAHGAVAKSIYSTAMLRMRLNGVALPLNLVSAVRIPAVLIIVLCLRGPGITPKYSVGHY
jgi:hypothetical protein